MHSSDWSSIGFLFSVHRYKILTHCISSYLIMLHFFTAQSNTSPIITGCQIIVKYFSTNSSHILSPSSSGCRCIQFLYLLVMNLNSHCLIFAHTKSQRCVLYQSYHSDDELHCLTYLNKTIGQYLLSISFSLNSKTQPKLNCLSAITS